MPDLKTSLNTSPLTADARAKLKTRLRDSVSDDQLSERLIEDLDPILRDDAPNWADEARWGDIGKTKGPSPDALAKYLAEMACADSRIAEGLARRAMYDVESGAEVGLGYFTKSGDPFVIYSDTFVLLYAQPLAQALLKLSCEGAKRFTDDTRARLQGLASATATP